MPITVTNLTCVYGAGTPFETTALRDVSVTVENGSFVGILGRTGCGNSYVDGNCCQVRNVRFTVFSYRVLKESIQF